MVERKEWGVVIGKACEKIYIQRFSTTDSSSSYPICIGNRKGTWLHPSLFAVIRSGCVCVWLCVCNYRMQSEREKILDFDGVLSLSLFYVFECIRVCCFVLSAISLIRSAFRTLLSRLRFKERKGMMCWRHSFLDVSREGTDFPSLNRHEEMK